MGNPTKRRKEDGEEQPKTLDKVLEEYKTLVKSTAFFSKEKFLEFFNIDKDRVFALFLSGIVHGPKIDSFTVPYQFRPYKITRDHLFKVTQISDGTETISGKELVSIALLENIANRSYDQAYFQLVKPSWMLGLRDVMTEEFVHQPTKEAKPQQATRIFTYDAQTACYASPSELVKVLSYDFVKVEDFKDVAIAVSSAAKEGVDVADLDLSTSEKLAAQLGKTDAAISVQALTQTLYASHLKGMNLQERITAFCVRPSPRLASSIGLKMPTKLQLFHTKGSSPVQTVDLGKLSADDDIILSNVAISQEFYQGVSVASEVQVVKYVKGLGVKGRAQKVAPLREPETMKASDFLKIAQAIEEDNKLSGKAGTAAASLPKQVDASDLTSFLQS